LSPPPQPAASTPTATAATAIRFMPLIVSAFHSSN
jgi:hypothetical protein